MGMATSLQNSILDQYFSVPRYMSLHLAPLEASGSFADEVSIVGTGYARQPLAGKLGPASNGLITNTGTITFPTILASYGGPVTDFAICSALTGGAIGLYGYFIESVLKGAGQAYQYPPGALRFQLR